MQMILSEIYIASNIFHNDLHGRDTVNAVPHLNSKKYLFFLW